MLNDKDRATYSWQLDVPGFGERGQSRLRGSTALVSRVGGLGGSLALSLAAAGFGKIVIAHAGDLREDDFNRQILMSRDWIGKSRVQCAAETLRRFNKNVEIEAIEENISSSNVSAILEGVDIVFCCAPLFQERFLLNQECVRKSKPIINCAMYSLEGQIIPIVPGKTPCLSCIYPEMPPHWNRRFPVIGAVSSLVGQIGALEGMKLMCNFGKVALGKMIIVDVSSMKMSKMRLAPRRVDCDICALN